MSKLSQLVVVFSLFSFLSSCNFQPSGERQGRALPLHDKSIRQREEEHTRIADDAETAKLKRRADQQTLMQMLATFDAALQKEQAAFIREQLANLENGEGYAIPGKDPI
jgi:hypothetical protein